MSRYRVLIVEDEHDIAGLIKRTLERTGETEAEIVGSGDAALKAVADHSPDLIILDLNLPVLSGVEVCRILRARADARHLPIIILTARSGEDDRVGGLELGPTTTSPSRSAFASSPPASEPCCGAPCPWATGRRSAIAALTWSPTSRRSRWPSTAPPCA